MIPIQKLLNEEIEKSRQEKKEITSWRPSRLGACLRGIYFERLGVEGEEFDERTLRVFNVGNMFEEWIIGLIEKCPDIKIEKQVRIEDKELGVSGYVDMVAEYQGVKKAYEIKSRQSKSFWWMKNNGEGANEQHKKQLWIYLKVLGIEEGGIIYISKDDLSILEYPIFLKDKKLGAETLEELRLLNLAWAEQKPELLPLPEEKSFKSRYCRFHKDYCLKVENTTERDKKATEEQLER